MSKGPLVYKPQDFQAPFFNSTALYPCRVGPWGDGKTLSMIMKGMYLSMLYPGNAGLIIRKRFNALERSTIRDFTTWTGLKVPDQKKVVEIDCGKGQPKSLIHFAHCENMEEFRDGLHGMNLGWAAIEQGDELDSADIFEMLIGRLRRILTPNEELQQKLIEAGVIKHYIPHFETLKKERRNEIEKAIIEVLGLPVRQIVTIANACGHNWIYKRWNDKKTRRGITEGYDYYDGKPFENVEFIPASTLKSWKDLKKTSPKKYNRYVLNSHEDYDIEGSYYASLMSDALKESRVEIQNLYDDTELVFTFWDLGVGDETVIWFMQFLKNRIHVIDYYEKSGKGMAHFSKILSSKNYEYMAHYLPHDVKNRLQGEQVTTRFDVLKRLRAKKHEDVFVVERHSISDRIESVRHVIPKCYFDVKTERGVECLNKYHRDVNQAKSSEEKKVFVDRPAHDEFSHGADGFGYMAVVYENNNAYFGNPGSIDKFSQEENVYDSEDNSDDFSTLLEIS